MEAAVHRDHLVADLFQVVAKKSPFFVTWVCPGGTKNVIHDGRHRCIGPVGPKYLGAVGGINAVVVDGLCVGASTWVEVPLGSLRIDPTRFVDVAPVTRPSATNGAVARRALSDI